jgi:O-antigen/teichoic acid export membrane protein
LIKKFLQDKEKRFLLLTQLIIAIIGLLTGKLIAVYFTPAEFGLFNLQFALYTFFFTLFLTPFVQFIKSYTNNLLPKIGFIKFAYLGVLLSLLLVFSMIITINLKYPNDKYLYFLTIITSPLNLLFVLISDYFNIKNKLRLFSLINIVKVLATLIFLTFLYLLKYQYSIGSKFLWIIQIFGFCAAVACYLPHYKIYYNTVYKISYSNFFKKYFRFAWPLIILAFWSWINNYFDRFAIEYYMEVNSVGIYNANYSVGSKFFLLLNPFFLTLLTPFVYSHLNISIKKVYIKKYVKVYTIISIPLLILIYFFGDFFGIILLSKKYESGFYLIFYISIAYFLMTMVFLYETVFYAEGKTKVILYSNIFAAILNIIINMVLIPLYGLNGAFLATLTSFLLRFLIIIIYFNKL